MSARHNKFFSGNKAVVSNGLEQSHTDTGLVGNALLLSPDVDFKRAANENKDLPIQMQF